MAKKITKRKSPPQPSPFAAVLQQLVVPAFEAESEPQDDGPSFGMSAPESGESLCIRGLLRGERLVHVLPMAIDGERTLLRLSLLSGYIISDCPSTVILLGNLLEPTPFQIRTGYQLRLMGRLSIGCDVTVRADDAPLVRQRLAELLQMAENLDRFMPLRLPHHISWKDVNGLEIDWDDLPHNNLHGFLDDGMAAQPEERTPLTGAMDLVEGNFTPVDFKSAAAKPDPGHAAFDHEIQLVSYQLLLKAIGETPPSLDLVFPVKTKTPQVIRFPSPPADAHRKRRVVSLLETAVEGSASNRHHP